MEKIGTNGGYGGDPQSCYPPHSCLCRDCCNRYVRNYSGTYGGGGPNYHFLTVEALENINRNLSALSALLENIAVSLGVEIKESESLAQKASFNVSVEIPSERMKKELTIGISPSYISGEEKQNSG
jgi:hypothetical protein